MTRKIRLAAAASAMAIASVAGISVATASPAAAQTAPSPIASVGYIISCVTGSPANLLPCLQNAIRQLLAGLGLPPIHGLNTTTVPQMSLPDLTSRLGNLPSALQTTPLANTAAVSAPLRQLVPTAPTNLGVNSVAPHVSKRFAMKSSALPKRPTAVPIQLVNIADHSAAAPGGSPVSASDAAALAGIAVVGAALVTRSARRRASHF